MKRSSRFPTHGNVVRNVTQVNKHHNAQYTHNNSDANYAHMHHTRQNTSHSFYIFDYVYIHVPYAYTVRPKEPIVVNEIPSWMTDNSVAHGGRLVVNRCTDFGPSSKLLPMLLLADSELPQSSVIVQFDDDIIYRTELVENQIIASLEHPNIIMSLSAWPLSIVTEDTDRYSKQFPEVLPAKHLVSSIPVNERKYESDWSRYDFLLGCGGVAYRKQMFFPGRADQISSHNQANNYTMPSRTRVLLQYSNSNTTEDDAVHNTYFSFAENLVNNRGEFKLLHINTTNTTAANIATTMKNTTGGVTFAVSNTTATTSSPESEHITLTTLPNPADLLPIFNYALHPSLHPCLMVDDMWISGHVTLLGIPIYTVGTDGYHPKFGHRWANHTPPAVPYDYGKNEHHGMNSLDNLSSTPQGLDNLKCIIAMANVYKIWQKM